MIKNILKKFGFIHCDELNKFPRGLVKRWDEYREDINSISKLLREDDVYIMLGHFKAHDDYFRYLYTLAFNKDYFDFVPIKQIGNYYQNSLGHILRKSEILSDKDK